VFVGNWRLGVFVCFGYNDFFEGTTLVPSSQPRAHAGEGESMNTKVPSQGNPSTASLETVGIDGVAYAVPRLTLPIAGEWAERRASVFAHGDVDALVAKVSSGIGVTEMAVADAHEDVVTLGAQAMRHLLEQQHIALADVGHVLFASEGGVDFSKSASSYVLGLMSEYFAQDTSHIANAEIKFACAASSYAIEYAAALLRSGMCARKYVVVIASDIARYELETPGEYTQGAGAVALALCRNPSLVALDEGPMATASADERDFFRPLFRSFPTVDGKYSVEIYLSLVEKAFGRFLKNKSAEQKMLARDVFGQAAGLLFHVPFPKMAEYIAGRLLLPAFEAGDALAPDQRAEAEKAFRKSPRFKEIFREKVEPSLVLSRRIGNIYSGSLPLALASFLTQDPEKLAALAGKPLLFFGYGSGSTARVYSGTLLSSAARAVRPPDLSAFARQSVGVDDYERLHAHSEVRQERNGHAMVAPVGPSVAKPRDEFVYLGMKAAPQSELGHRVYKVQS
jgi:hydroxymethylglutaryl-CoA synthase